MFIVKKKQIIQINHELMSHDCRAIVKICRILSTAKENNPRSDHKNRTSCMAIFGKKKEKFLKNKYYR